MKQKHPPHMLTVMTPFPYSISADASLLDAQTLMDQHGFGHLPVTRNDDIAGLLSERDLQRAHLVGHPLSDEQELKVGDICSPRPYLCDVSDPLARVLDVMAEKRLDAVLVLKEGEMVGIFTAIDACRVLAETISEYFTTEDNNAA
jgi:acetoin utilization protein AcuB